MPRSRTPRRLRTLVATAVLAVGCRPTPPPAPAPPASVRLAPATARYLLIEHRHVDQRYRGQPIVTDATIRTLLAVAVDSAATGFLLEAFVDSVEVSGDAGVMPHAVTTAAGGRLRADVAPNGMVRSVIGPADRNHLLDQLTLRLHELLPSLPPGGAGPGVTWQDTIQMRGWSGDVPIVIEAHRSHEGASRWSDLDDRPVLPFATTTRYELSGEGDRAGQWVSMTGTGVAHLRRLVTRDGLVTLGIRTDTLQAFIELPSSGLRIPLTQIRTDTLRRLD